MNYVEEYVRHFYTLLLWRIQQQQQTPKRKYRKIENAFHNNRKNEIGKINIKKNYLLYLFSNTNNHACVFFISKLFLVLQMLGNQQLLFDL